MKDEDSKKTESRDTDKDGFITPKKTVALRTLVHNEEKDENMNKNLHIIN